MRIAPILPLLVADFLPAPRAMWRRLRTFHARQPTAARDHGPLGALSVYAMLLVVLAQAASGLFIESDGFFAAAPLRGLVAPGVARFMSVWHHRLPALILVLVVLHVAVIFFCLLWKRENLIRPMVDGWKWARPK